MPLWWLKWSRICLQGKRPGFDPWVGKISWRRRVTVRSHTESDTTERLTLSLIYHFALPEFFSAMRHKGLWNLSSLELLETTHSVSMPAQELLVLPLQCWPTTMQDGTQSPLRIQTAHPPAKVCAVLYTLAPKEHDTGPCLLVLTSLSFPCLSWGQSFRYTWHPV